MSPSDNPVSPVADIDPIRMATLFASSLRIAPSAFLRREISARMQERLDYLRMQPKVVLDAGCGTGDDMLALRRRYANAQMMGVDFSAAMLAETRSHMIAATPLLRRWRNQFFGNTALQLLQADLASVPASDASVDLLWSNLALHWHPHPAQVFAEWHRLMRPEGALMFSCFGPDTFKEVRQAFVDIDDHPHTLSFVDMHDLGDVLVQAGFPSPIMDRETITLTYENTTDLIADVRAFGGNPLRQRRRGLLSRAQSARVMRTLETLRNAGGVIPLTLEIVYGHAFREAAQPSRSGENLVRFFDKPKRI